MLLDNKKKINNKSYIMHLILLLYRQSGSKPQLCMNERRKED